MNTPEPMLTEEEAAERRKWLRTIIALGAGVRFLRAVPGRAGDMQLRDPTHGMGTICFIEDDPEVIEKPSLGPSAFHAPSLTACRDSVALCVVEIATATPIVMRAAWGALSLGKSVLWIVSREAQETEWLQFAMARAASGQYVVLAVSSKNTTAPISGAVQ